MNTKEHGFKISYSPPTDYPVTWISRNSNLKCKHLIWEWPTRLGRLVPETNGADMLIVEEQMIPKMLLNRRSSEDGHNLVDLEMVDLIHNTSLANLFRMLAWLIAFSPHSSKKTCTIPATWWFVWCTGIWSKFFFFFHLEVHFWGFFSHRDHFQDRCVLLPNKMKAVSPVRLYQGTRIEWFTVKK